jgi:hypothetical protein
MLAIPPVCLAGLGKRRLYNVVAGPSELWPAPLRPKGFWNPREKLSRPDVCAVANAVEEPFVRRKTLAPVRGSVLFQRQSRQLALHPQIISDPLQVCKFCFRVRIYLLMEFGHGM